MLQVPGRHVVDQNRRLGPEELARDGADRARHIRESDASLDRVREPRHLGSEVEDPDVDDLGVEDLLDLVADDVVDGLEFELSGERLLDTVDQRELGVPLPRLVHQARVLERDAEALSQRLQELLVGRAERVLPVDVLQRYDARHLAAGDERHGQNGLGISPEMTLLPYRSAA
jgi:hypothetical protein